MIQTHDNAGPCAGTDDELQAWLDEQDAIAAAHKVENDRLNRLARRPFAHMQHDFRVHLYARAIGAKA